MMENPYAELENKYASNLQQQNDMLSQQSQIQKEQSQANTEQAINEINQQKEYANQDFNKEARGAYTDYQKTINPYGVQAEQMASNGLGNSGYSESSRINAFNTYQNRYATAKSSADKIQQDFNNQIAQARLSGNKELAEIALNELQTKMNNLWNQLNLDTTLAQNKVSYNQWLDEFNYNKQQDEIANAFAREQFEYQKQQDALSRASSGSRSSSSSRRSSGSSGSGSSYSFSNDGSSEFSNTATETSTPKTTSNSTKSNNKNWLTGMTLQDAANTNNELRLWKHWK